MSRVEQIKKFTVLPTDWAPGRRRADADDEAQAQADRREVRRARSRRSTRAERDGLRAATAAAAGRGRGARSAPRCAAVRRGGARRLPAGAGPARPGQRPRPARVGDQRRRGHLFFTDADAGELLRMDRRSSEPRVLASGIRGAGRARPSCRTARCWSATATRRRPRAAIRRRRACCGSTRGPASSSPTRPG